MNKYLIVIIILFAILTVFEIVLSQMKKRCYNQLMSFLMEKKINQFDELLSRKSTKFFVPVYNSIFLNVNKAMMMGDCNLIEKLMDDAKNIRMNDKQKIHLYSNVFSYFLSKKDEEKCKKYYEEVIMLKDYPIKEYIEMVYDTFINKGYKYIDKAEKMLLSVSDQDKENIETLIETMRLNKVNNIQRLGK